MCGDEITGASHDELIERFEAHVRDRHGIIKLPEEMKRILRERK
jgi:predicted small metal-binding protein